MIHKNNLKFFKKVCFLTISILAINHHSISARPLNSKETLKSESTKWHPTLNLGGKLGNQRRIGQIGLFTPLWQDNMHLLYLDLRFLADSKSAREGNFGIGKRWISDSQNYAFGTYLFYDRRRTQLSNMINQVTLGFEVLSESWDYRLNLYYPQHKTKQVAISKEVVASRSKRVFRGHNEYLITENTIRGNQIKEVPLRGLDLEVGNSIPGFAPLRIYGAYYHFQGRSGAKTVRGARVRGNLEVNNYFSVLAEASYDGVRKKNGFIGIQARIPLGTVKRAQTLTKLEKKMGEFPERDIDIVTNKTSPASYISTEETKILKSTNNYFVEIKKRPSTAGQGTYENPYAENNIASVNALQQKLEEDNTDRKWFVVSNGKVQSEVSPAQLERRIKSIPIKYGDKALQKNIPNTRLPLTPHDRHSDVDDYRGNSLENFNLENFINFLDERQTLTPDLPQGIPYGTNKQEEIPLILKKRQKAAKSAGEKKKNELLGGAKGPDAEKGPDVDIGGNINEPLGGGNGPDAEAEKAPPLGGGKKKSNLLGGRKISAPKVKKGPDLRAGGKNDEPLGGGKSPDAEKGPDVHVGGDINELLGGGKGPDAEAEKATPLGGGKKKSNLLGGRKISAPKVKKVPDLLAGGKNNEPLGGGKGPDAEAEIGPEAHEGQQLREAEEQVVIKPENIDDNEEDKKKNSNRGVAEKNNPKEVISPAKDEKEEHIIPSHTKKKERKSLTLTKPKIPTPDTETNSGDSVAVKSSKEKEEPKTRLTWIDIERLKDAKQKLTPLSPKAAPTEKDEEESHEDFILFEKEDEKLPLEDKTSSPWISTPGGSNRGARSQKRNANKSLVEEQGSISVSGKADNTLPESVKKELDIFAMLRDATDEKHEIKEGEGVEFSTEVVPFSHPDAPSAGNSRRSRTGRRNTAQTLITEQGKSSVSDEPKSTRQNRKGKNQTVISAKPKPLPKGDI